MAHFAELDANNTVLRVIVVGNKDCLDPAGNESEAVGIAFCQSLYGPHTRWVQTSYNGNMRHKYAGIGDTYDQTRDAFISPQPFPSWSLNEDTYAWEAPVATPDYEMPFVWDEANLNWQPLT